MVGHICHPEGFSSSTGLSFPASNIQTQECSRQIKRGRYTSNGLGMFYWCTERAPRTIGTHRCYYHWYCHSCSHSCYHYYSNDHCHYHYYYYHSGYCWQLLLLLPPILLLPQVMPLPLWSLLPQCCSLVLPSNKTTLGLIYVKNPKLSLILQGQNTGLQ